MAEPSVASVRTTFRPLPFGNVSVTVAVEALGVPCEFFTPYLKV